MLNGIKLKRFLKYIFSIKMICVKYPDFKMIKIIDTIYRHSLNEEIKYSNEVENGCESDTLKKCG
jgi:hypothetical protein